MKTSRFIATLVPALALSVAFLSPVQAADDVKQERAEVRDTVTETLARLYQTTPKARQAIQKAAGYAVFSDFGVKIFVAGGGYGHGIAVNNKTKHETFMKMVEIQAGLGIGVKQFRLVWVFERTADFNRFVNSGWELGGQATAAAQLGGEGAAYAGALSVAPGVWLYQITDDGLALELTVKGTKYYKDDELN